MACWTLPLLAPPNRLRSLRRGGPSHRPTAAPGPGVAGAWLLPRRRLRSDQRKRRCPESHFWATALNTTPGPGAGGCNTSQRSQVIMRPAICPAVIYNETDNRREQWVWGGWNVGPYDVPRPPELSPLDSAQSRRAVKQSTPAGGPQPKLN
jgi:hypothetical protein